MEASPEKLVKEMSRKDLERLCIALLRKREFDGFNGRILDSRKHYHREQEVCNVLYETLIVLRSECDYCKKWHDPRVACPEYVEKVNSDGTRKDSIFYLKAIAGACKQIHDLRTDNENGITKTS
jgi:hypothetical protein